MKRIISFLTLTCFLFSQAASTEAALDTLHTFHLRTPATRAADGGDNDNRTLVALAQELVPHFYAPDWREFKNEEGFSFDEERRIYSRETQQGPAKDGGQFSTDDLRAFLADTFGVQVESLKGLQSIGTPPAFYHRKHATFRIVIPERDAVQTLGEIVSSLQFTLSGQPDVTHFGNMPIREAYELLYRRYIRESQAHDGGATRVQLRKALLEDLRSPEKTGEEWYAVGERIKALGSLRKDQGKRRPIPLLTADIALIRRFSTAKLVSSDTVDWRAFKDAISKAATDLALLKAVESLKDQGKMRGNRLTIRRTTIREKAQKEGFRLGEITALLRDEGFSLREKGARQFYSRNIPNSRDIAAKDGGAQREMFTFDALRGLLAGTTVMDDPISFNPSLHQNSAFFVWERVKEKRRNRLHLVEIQLHPDLADRPLRALQIIVDLSYRTANTFLVRQANLEEAFERFEARLISFRTVAGAKDGGVLRTAAEQAAPVIVEPLRFQRLLLLSP